MSGSTETQRESAKRQRREAILAAAEALIRARASTDFSMQALADAAGLSLATTYNLIGPKSTVLYALLNVRADAISDVRARLGGQRNPQSLVKSAARFAVRQFAGDPEFYRPLMRHLLGVPDPLHHTAFMARGLEYWRGVAALLGEQGQLRSDANVDELARFAHVYFTGALDMWIHEEYDEPRFLGELERYLRLLLLPAASRPVLAIRQ